ncbi:MAG: hypothetical protein H0U76_18565 [Ktedonobacteraceae bacterium]|nr:hypothetical protein [Ktedonobacteraceae bacterium]
MGTTEPVVIRLLVAKASDGRTHDYALDVNGLILVDKATVRRIEVSPLHAQSFSLVTDSGTAEMTSADLYRLISGHIWTEPARAHREACRFARQYHPFST